MSSDTPRAGARPAAPRRFIADQLRRLRRLLYPVLQRPAVLGDAQVEAGLDLTYRFLLARPAEEGGRQHYLQRMREQGMTLREVAMEIAASDEFQIRLRSSLLGFRDVENVLTPPPPQPETAVDARELSRTLTVEQLAKTAEDYYRTTLEFKDRYLSKPLADPFEAPDILGSFAQLLAGLRLTPGMTVLDFGAGTCWATRSLTQLGCAVIATDVSPTALELGKELFARMPPVGNHPAPRFLVFDGHHIDLPDASVDRISCFDAFHHVPNPAAVMAELGRVLRPGGIAGFSEPGPHHSKAAQSQYEMKNYTALENDVVMSEVWDWAQAAGFTGLELAIFSTRSHRVPLEKFHELIAGGDALDTYGDQLRTFLTGHQTFFLRKGGAAVRDSRDRDGLMGEITVRLPRTSLGAGEPILGDATVQNVGTSVWLPASAPVGGVSLGVHLRQQDGRPLDLDFGRVAIEGEMKPGDVHALAFALKALAPGDYLLEFDLVSEHVAWFEMNGSPTATVKLTVR